MSSAIVILKELSTAGVSIRLERGRLIVEARPGVITPDIRAELAKRKAELICALQREQATTPFEDPRTSEGLHEVACLLAVAFQRYAAIQRVPVQRPEDEVTKELALSPPESVHGHG